MGQTWITRKPKAECDMDVDTEPLLLIQLRQAIMAAYIADLKLKSRRGREVAGRLH